MQESLANGESGDLFGAEPAIQAQQQIEPLDGRGVPIEQPQFVELKRIDFADAPLDSLSVWRNAAVDFIQVFRLPPDKLLRTMHPFEEAVKFTEIMSNR